MSDLDLQREIDRSFGDGPDHRPLEQRLVAGRRTVLRRRVAAVGAVLAVVAVAGTAYVSLEPAERAGSDQVAVDPPSPTPAWEDATPVRYRQGELEVRAGVVVHQRIENPYGLTLPERSDAFDLTFRGQRQWVILTGDGEEWGSQATVPSREWADFEAFVGSQADTLAGDGRWRRALRLRPDGTDVPTRGTEVLQRTDDPRLGEAFAPAGTTTGVAILQPAGSDEVSSVAWRVVDGELEVLRVPPGEVVGATFDELLSYVRGRYAAGQEL